MAKKDINKATTYLINLDWKKDIFENINGEVDRELAKERLVYLFESMENILLHQGSQEMSGNMDIDYPVKVMIRQILTMRKDEQDFNVDYEIARMKKEGLSSNKIAERLTQMGKKIGGSGVRQKAGWNNPLSFLTEENKQQAEIDNNIDNVDNKDKTDSQWIF